MSCFIFFFFFVLSSVRERAKNHRSTTSDWNAKIREQRIHQIQQSQYYDGKWRKSWATDQNLGHKSVESICKWYIWVLWGFIRNFINSIFQRNQVTKFTINGKWQKLNKIKKSHPRLEMISIRFPLKGWWVITLIKFFFISNLMHILPALPEADVVVDDDDQVVENHG